MASLVRGAVKLTTIGRSFTLKCATRRLFSVHAQPVKYLKPSRIHNFSVITRNITTETTKPVSRSNLRDLSSVLENELQVLDDQARKWGRVDREKVEAALKLVKKSGEVSEQQAVMLLRCTGSLMAKETKEDRAKIFQQIWDQLPALGVNYNVSHYNAALRIQLENGKEFSPPVILAEMEQTRNLIPNRITYQLLIAQYCETGDIEGARKVLEFMKSKELAIGEPVFNCLIKGYLRQGDSEGARNVLSSMKENNLEPGHETYKSFLCGYAEKGDMDGINQIFKEASEEDITLYGRHIFAAVTAAAENDQSECVQKLLELLPSSTGYNHDALNCMFQLIALGKDEAAIQVFYSLKRENATLESNTLQCRQLLRSMVMRERPLPKILEIRTKLSEEGMCGDDVNYIGALALKYEKPDLALELFRHLKSIGEPVRDHFFWPVFLQYGKSKNIEGVKEATKTYYELVSENNDSIALLVNNAYPALRQCGQSLEAVRENLTELGIKEADINTAEVFGMIREGKFQEALDRAAENKVDYVPYLLKLQIPVGFSKSNKDIDGVVEILSRASKGKQEYADLNGNILSDLVNKASLEVKEALIKGFNQKGLKILGRYADLMKINLKRKGVSEEVLSMLDAMSVTTNVEGGKRASPPNYMNKSFQDLEALSEENAKTGKVDKALDKWLLSKYCSAGEVEKADKLKESLDSQGFVYGAEMLRQLAFLASKHKGDLQEALKYKNLMETQFPEFNGYISLVLNIAKLLTKEGKVEEAIEELKKYSEKHGDVLKETAADTYMLNDGCIDLVEACRSLPDPEVSKTITITLFDQGYIKKGTYKLLDSMMRTHVESGDPDAMLAACDYCVSEFRRAPLFSEIFKVLIEKEDADRLQKAVDMVTTIFGEMNVLHSLVISLIECGKPKQARKILETPGIRAVMPVLKEGCNKFVNLNKEKELVQLVEITKDLFAADRDELLFSLIRLYAKGQDWKKILDVYATYEEEYVRPRPRTLRYIAKVLESKGEEVPFEVPIAEAPKANEVSKSPWKKGSPEEKMIALMKEDKIGEAIALLEESEKSGNPVQTSCLVEIGDTLLQSRKNRTFRAFISKLSNLGEVEAIQEIAKTKEQDYYIHGRLFNAYIQAERAEEILDILNSNPQEVAKYTTTQAICELLERQPYLQEMVEQVVHKGSAEGMKNQALQHLTGYYILDKQVDKARNILENNESLKDSMKLLVICQKARNDKSIDVLESLLDLFSAKPKKLTAVYSELINLTASEGNWSQAFQYFEHAKGQSLTEKDLYAPSLIKLETLLQQNNQKVPWVPGSLQRTRDADTSSSSSSSSSDSDSDGPTVHENVMK